LHAPTLSREVIEDHQGRLIPQLIEAIGTSSATPLEFPLDCFALSETAEVVDSFDEV
jgi:hypothetical protein